MAVQFGFYNSVGGDRKYDAADFAIPFNAIMEDGVIRGIGSNFDVTATGGLNLNVGIGLSWFDDTYTYNDAVLPMTLDSSEVSNNRYDAIVIETDSSNGVRANSIKIIKGVPALSPQVPVMTHTATLNHYAICYIYRGGGTASVSQANVTKTVGTPVCPFAVSRLLDRATEPVSMHRNVFRGKNLGAAVTATQRATIKAGTFDDLYVGDYWEANGVKWRIVDIDYFLNKGRIQNRVYQHHAVIMPDVVMRRGRMNEDFAKANQGAYAGSDARGGVHFATLGTQAEAVFGPHGTNFLNWDGVVTTQLTDGRPSAATWSSNWIEIPNQIMVFGNSVFSSPATGGNYPSFVQTEAHTQLALFRLAPWFIPAANVLNDDRAYFLSDVLSPVMWAGVGREGEAQFLFANGYHGFRPIFAIV